MNASLYSDHAPLQYLNFYIKKKASFPSKYQLFTTIFEFLFILLLPFIKTCIHIKFLRKLFQYLLFLQFNFSLC